MERLDEAAVAAGLEGLAWERHGDAIVTVRTFGDFAEALAWVNEVGALAEQRDHHPDIAISWNRVTLNLTTHSDGGLTAKDLDLAAAIDALGPRPAAVAAGLSSVPQVLELTSRVAAGGDGIGHLPDGRVVFVEGALPGETVTAVITETRRDFARARVVAVWTPSPDRVEAPCPHRRRGCGGCPWQEVAPPAQIRLKEEIVADALRRIGKVEAPVLAATAPVAVTGYRTTVHLAIDADGRPAYRRRHERTPLAVDSCLVAHPWITEVLASLRLPGHRAATVRVGVAGGERLVVASARSRSRSPATFVPAGAELVAAGSNAFVHERVGGRVWRVSARAFFQPGPAAAEVLVAAVDDAVGDALGPGGLLVDAYAGVGVLGGVLAARGRARLVAVESDHHAARDASHNLADLDATVVTAEVGSWPGMPADVVVADPARPGLGRPGVATLLRCAAARIVLVSCDPASLGRDAALLASAGYELVRTRLVDSFAQTFHIEAVSVFDRSAPAGRAAPA